VQSAWIGLVEVRPRPGVDRLEGAVGAFVNVLVWTADFKQYRELALRELADSGFDVVKIEDAEPLADRLERGAVVRPELLLKAALLNKGNRVEWDSFYSYPSSGD
jgi:hypothetical protein